MEAVRAALADNGYLAARGPAKRRIRIAHAHAVLVHCLYTQWDNGNDIVEPPDYIVRDVDPVQRESVLVIDRAGDAHANAGEGARPR